MEPEPKLRVLIIEDEALIAHNLRLTLEDLGYEALPACHTYAQAEAVLAAPGPLAADMVLLDINLGSANPAHTGLALARHLSGPQRPPFIFLTAYNDLDTIRQATRLRPSGYLIKPVNGAILFAAIQTALERFSHQPPTPPETPESPEAVEAAEAPAALSEAAAPDYFFVKLSDKIHKLWWADVSALEAGKNYVTLRTAGYKGGYPIRGSLTYVLDQLVPPALHAQFIRVNRRQALNRAIITGFDEEWVYGGDERFENGGQVQEQLLALGVPAR